MNEPRRSSTSFFSRMSVAMMSALDTSITSGMIPCTRRPSAVDTRRAQSNGPTHVGGFLKPLAGFGVLVPSMKEQTTESGDLRAHADAGIRWRDRSSSADGDVQRGGRLDDGRTFHTVVRPCAEGRGQTSNERTTRERRRLQERRCGISHPCAMSHSGTPRPDH